MTEDPPADPFGDEGFKDWDFTNSYPVELLTNPPPDALVCIVCKDIPVKVRRCPGECSRVMCEGCLDKMFPRDNDHRPCAICKFNTSKDRWFRSGGASWNGLLEVQELLCPYHEDGCAFTGGMGEMLDHRKDCPMEVADCPHSGEGCTERFRRKDFEEHQCKFLPITCNFCNIKMPFSLGHAHVGSCDYEYIPCANAGCKEEVLRGEMEWHLQSDCQFTPCVCAFCGAETTKGKYESHIEESGDHGRGIAGRLDSLRTQIRMSSDLFQCMARSTPTMQLTLSNPADLQERFEAIQDLSTPETRVANCGRQICFPAKGGCSAMFSMIQSALGYDDDRFSATVLWASNPSAGPGDPRVVLLPKTPPEEGAAGGRLGRIIDCDAAFRQTKALIPLTIFVETASQEQGEGRGRDNPEAVVFVRQYANETVQMMGPVSLFDLQGGGYVASLCAAMQRITGQEGWSFWSDTGTASFSRPLPPLPQDGDTVACAPAGSVVPDPEPQVDPAEEANARAIAEAMEWDGDE